MTAVYDPLLITIRAFEAGCAEFNRLADHTNDDQWDTLEDITFGPALARIQQWKGSASSIEGAIAALRISLLDSGGVNGMEAQERMVKAALEYLESAFPGSPASSRPQTIYSLIAAYWTAYEALIIAMDDVSACEDAKEAHDAAKAIEDQAQDRWNAARLAVCSFIPTRPDEARYKTQFLKSIAAENCGRLDDDETAALLSSLGKLVLYDSGKADDVD